MTCAPNQGPVSSDASPIDLPIDVEDKLKKTIAAHPPGKTLIDVMSAEDFLAPEDVKIMVGTLKAS